MQLGIHRHPVNGTSYKKRDFLITKNDESMEFGELVVILIQHNATVFFVLDMHTSEYHNEYHMYSVTKLTAQLLCLNITHLVDFYPFVRSRTSSMGTESFH